MGDACVCVPVEIFNKSRSCQGKFCRTTFYTSAMRSHDEYFIFISVVFQTGISRTVMIPLSGEIYAFCFVRIQGAHAVIKIGSFWHNVLLMVGLVTSLADTGSITLQKYLPIDELSKRFFFRALTFFQVDSNRN